MSLRVEFEVFHVYKDTVEPMNISIVKTLNRQLQDFNKLGVLSYKNEFKIYD